MIDFRSDTVTKPTPEMRRAMAEAEVGDDVFEDDPTVNELERYTAEILGKEAALYMASGTMSNQVAIRAQTQPGDEIMIHELSHVYLFEAGGPAALSGVMPKVLRGDRGVFTVEEVAGKLRPDNVHFPPTRLIVLENTVNRGAGKIWSIERIAEIADFAHEHGLLMHLDGARLWNAAVATGIPEAGYAKYFDSVSVCFSKGLGAPVGSALVGAKALIKRARRFRKMLGGGMRQAGIIAAGALYALRNHRERLAEDHENAKILADAISKMPHIELDPDSVETNLIIFKVGGLPAQELADNLYERGVWVLPTEKDSIRAVTNLEVSREQIYQAIEIFSNVTDEI